MPFAIPPKVAAAALLHASKDYEVMLRGKLVTIDGIFYYVKSDEVVFSDCPLCEDRSMACSILGSHLVTDHMLTSIPCYANGCDSIIQVSCFQCITCPWAHLKPSNFRIRLFDLVYNMYCTTHFVSEQCPTRALDRKTWKDPVPRLWFRLGNNDSQRAL